MQGTGIGRDLMEIASLLIAVALISMFVKNSDKTSQLITTGGTVFGNLLEASTGGKYF